MTHVMRRKLTFIAMIVIALILALPFLVWWMFPEMIARYSPWVGPCVSALARMRQREDFSFRDRFFERSANVAELSRLGHDDEVRIVAIWMLGIVGDPETLGAIVQGVNDSNYAIKVHSMESLSHFEDSNVIVPLLSSFSSDKDGQIRGIVADGLGRHHNHASIETLKKMCYDSSASVKCRAIMALSKALTPEEKRDITVFIGELKRHDKTLESCALRALDVLSRVDRL